MSSTNAEPYDVLAPIYDHWQYSFDRPYNPVVAKLLKKELRRYRPAGDMYLDCACGTGDIALLMAGLGWSVVGVDSSAGMLRQAEQKTEERGYTCRFVCQRLEKLDVDSVFHVAGSFYDSLNHITSKRALQSVLKRIRRHLETGGLFFFDTNTLACYRNLWNTLTVGNEKTFTVIIDNNFQEAKSIAVSDITLFTGTGGTMYRKENVRIKERWYSDDELKQMLGRAGFTVLRSEPLHLFGYDGTDAYKRWWVCRAAE